MGICIFTKFKVKERPQFLTARLSLIKLLTVWDFTLLIKLRVLSQFPKRFQNLIVKTLPTIQIRMSKKQQKIKILKQIKALSIFVQEMRWEV
jgi:hypothetical protein